MERKLETPGFIYITCDIVAVTDRAVLVNDGTKQEWIPKSQIEDPEEFNRGESGVEILMSEWIAKSKGFV